ncbi:MAG TPA: phospholipase D-like domain-containing protein, partial [Anaerolineales bacterium]
MNTVTKLSRDLAPALNQAEEIWIAVAMLTMQGLDFLLDNTRPNCKINLLVGVDLPTDPKALEKLIQLQAEKEFRVQLFIENKEFFHPKLYLIKDLYSYIGFIGSANFTNGGLNENIELTIQVDNDHLCNELKSWFFELFNRAKPLTSSFAKEYRANYSKRKELKSKEERIVRVNKKKFNQEF